MGKNATSSLVVLLADFACVSKRQMGGKQRDLLMETSDLKRALPRRQTKAASNRVYKLPHTLSPSDRRWPE